MTTTNSQHTTNNSGSCFSSYDSASDSSWNAKFFLQYSHKGKSQRSTRASVICWSQRVTTPSNPSFLLTGLSKVCAWHAENIFPNINRCSTFAVDKFELRGSPIYNPDTLKDTLRKFNMERESSTIQYLPFLTDASILCFLTARTTRLQESCQCRHVRAITA